MSFWKPHRSPPWQCQDLYGRQERQLAKLANEQLKAAGTVGGTGSGRGQAAAVGPIELLMSFGVADARG